MDELLNQVRHSTAHIMAAAVLEIFPQARFGIGPPIETGFYYDFELPRPLTMEDLPVIEQKMRAIIKQRQPFKREVVDKERAIELFKGQPYKIELIQDLPPEEEISIYTVQNFLDLCRGPHVGNSGELKAEAFKLLSIAGSYWRGDEKRPMLQRIYASAWLTKEALVEHLHQMEEAKKRDHRKLGQDLEIFDISDEIGKGLVLWLPNGAVLRDELEGLARETEFLYGYKRVSSPHIAKAALYYRSGHLPYYKDSMFPPMTTEEGEEFYLKPMNCPHHHMIYKATPKSYRDLPLRLAEYGSCYRYEKSGELAGLLRVRALTMNDAHIYTPLNQVKEEFKACIELHRYYYQMFRLKKYWIRLSIHDTNKAKFVENEKMWIFSEEIVEDVLKSVGIEYETIRGEAAFYGPKVDYQVKNVMGREETLSTIQLDFIMAERFNLEFVNAEGQVERPYIIHRAPLSVHERMIAILLEHFAGAFPTWLSPVQVLIVPVAVEFIDYARSLGKELHTRLFRAEVDDSKDSFNKKVRNGTLRKIPNIFIVGDKERQANTITWRRYAVKQQFAVPFAQALQILSRLKTQRIMDNFEDIEIQNLADRE